MADKPASAGSRGAGSGSASSSRGLVPADNAAPPPDAIGPPPVHHEAPGPREVPGHRRAPADSETGPALLSWLVYLMVLAGVAAGLFIAWQGSKSAGHGAGLVGCSLLAAALARLILPPRYAGPLSSRRKTSDVLAFAAFGAGVLGVALMLP